MFAALKVLFETTIAEGHLAVTDASGRACTFGDGTGPRVAIRFKDRRMEWQFVRDPELAAGEGYMQGRIVMDEGSVYDFLDLAMRNLAVRPLPHWAQAFARLRRLKRGWDESNKTPRARDNVAHHYDIDPRIYELFLDADRQYSCAYFAPGITSLEEAQLAKKRHIAAKLRLQPGQSILDIGCGWGGLARYLAATCAANVTGITLSLSQIQAALAEQAARPVAASDREGPRGDVTFAFQDYRSIEGCFDRIVSVGMFEHVGNPNYAIFFKSVADHLADDGIALIHAIGRLDGPAPTNPFVAKYIFPGGALPALSEVTSAIEGSGLFVTDIEILRVHYAETLRAWRRRFVSARQRAIEIAGEEFFRMWEFYLAGCEAAFRHQFLMVFQVQLAHKIDVLPITRDYMVEAERRLAARDSPLGRPVPLSAARPGRQEGDVNTG